MLDQFKSIVSTQYEAALCMLDDCLRKCPDAAWDRPVAKYPFWQVAHHVLIFTDLYLSPSKAAFEFRADFNPGGWKDFDDEYPARRFEREELTNYVQVCRRKALDIVAAETAESLAGESGFDWLKFSRAELHLYNIRHVQHHTAQLGACLRQLDGSIDPRWVGRGWR
jgi:uncharacterized damage-inducible protein DinB